MRRPLLRALPALLACALQGAGALAPPAAGAAETSRSARAAARTELGPLGVPVSAPKARASARGPQAHAAAGPTVTRSLSSLLSSGQITEAVYKKDYGIYAAAKRSLGRLSGTRRSELGVVLANTQAMAAAGQLTASRQAAVFLTLEKNQYWWTTKPLLSGEVRLSSRRRRSSGSAIPARASRSSGSARSARATATTSRATKTRTCASSSKK